MLPLNMKCDELFKKLKKNGWREVRQKGSHKILRKEGEKNTIVFPYHRGKEVQLEQQTVFLNKLD